MEKQDLTVEVGGGLLNVRVGAIIMKEDKVLMVSNSRADYCYSVGGRVKFGESTEEAVKREVLEETGVSIEVDRLGFIHENYFVCDTEKDSGKPVYEISFFFFMKVPDDFTPVCNSFSEDNEKESLLWIDLDSEKKFYPEFYRTELKNPSMGVKHILTRQIEL